MSPISFSTARARGAVLAALALLAAPLGAQTASPDTLPAGRSRTQTQVVRQEGPLLDVPISRAEYRLGPGDAVEVAILGDVNELFSLVVSPEGALLLPGLGTVPVLGVNLDGAEERVRALVRRYYRGVEVRLALTRVRSFKVFVVGDVPHPGVRTATAATRVSELVEDLAHDPTGAPGGVRSGEPVIRRRNVILRRAAGDSVAVDLVRFHQTGDVSANPTLREGDAVVLPAVDARVDVFGRVHFPGPYEHRRGETLAELLLLANGGGDFPADAADSVRVVRFEDAEQTRTFLFSRAEAVGAAGRAFPLHPFDGVFIAQRANFMRQRTATVRGEVLHPGSYPIRPDTTTVRDLIAMAGGFTPRASIAEARLRRPDVRLPTGGAESALAPELLSREDRRILQVRSQGDAAAVVVDFAALYAGGEDARDVPLRAGDVLEVPVAASTVTVLGAVRTPGQIPHVGDLSVEQVVQRAGGFTRRADRGRTVVLHARTGARSALGEGAVLEPGDLVVVPFREDRDLLTYFQGAQVILGTISSVVLLILALK